MVCGFCPSVFHFIDQFISRGDQPPDRHGQWRHPKDVGGAGHHPLVQLVRDQVIVSDSDYDEISIRRNIKTKWFGLSGQLKEAWIWAAEVLNHLSRVSQGLMKPNEIVKRNPGDIPEEDEDVIHKGKAKTNIDFFPDNKFDDDVAQNGNFSKQKHLHDHSR